MSSIIPDSWHKKAINECCEILDSLRIPLNSEERAKRKGNYPYYGANGIQGYIDDYIFEGDAILLAEDGGNFEQYADRPIAQWVTGKFWVNNHAHILRAKDGSYDKWIFYSLVHKNILKNINGGTRAKLNQSDLKEIEILLPPLQEQKKIAAILTSVDEVIEKTQQQIDKLQDLKKATMNDLLTKGIGHTEFKDSELGRIPKSWEVNALKNLALVLFSNVDKKTNPSEKPVLLCNYLDVYKNINIKNGLDFMQATANQREIDKFSIKKGDVIITKDSEQPDDIAISTYVSEDFNNVLCGYHLAMIRPFKDKLHGKYLSYLFGLEKIQHNFYCLANGSTRFGLTSDAINNSLIYYAPISEQKKIADILNSMDKSIEEKQRKLEKIKDLKKGLMNDLLTGKVRVAA